MGALLQIADHASGKTYHPAYDGNGNIMALVNGATGAIAATYEYSPFGETITATANDSTVSDQPFRFSTKFTDLETGLVYYGRRYYSPSQGRFLGRDPIEEQGGLHLYAFCANDGINAYDVLGEFLQPVGAINDGFGTSVSQMFQLNAVDAHIVHEWTDDGREWVRVNDQWQFEVLRTTITDTDGNQYDDVRLVRNGVTYVSVVSGTGGADVGWSGGAILGYVTDSGKTNMSNTQINRLLRYNPDDQYNLGNQLSGYQVNIGGLHNVFRYSPLAPPSLADLNPQELLAVERSRWPAGGGMQDGTADAAAAILGGIGLLKNLGKAGVGLAEALLNATRPSGDRFVRVASPQAGSLFPLSAGAQRVLGNLASIADQTIADAIRLRGGTASNVARLETGMGQRTVAEVAEAAARGEVAAVQAIKMVKQAAKKGQRY